MFKTVLKQVSKKKINKKKLILLLLIMGVILFASVTMIVGVISGLSTLRSAAISWVVLNMNEDVKVKEIEDITQIPIEDNIKVCRECKMELSEENYEKWVNLIIKKDTK
jgi:hypothetical protein